LVSKEKYLDHQKKEKIEENYILSLHESGIIRENKRSQRRI
jgi:hypothetical protein